MSSREYRCRHCSRYFHTGKGLHLHQQMGSLCRDRERLWHQQLREVHNASGSHNRIVSDNAERATESEPEENIDVTMGENNPFFILPEDGLVPPLLSQEAHDSFPSGTVRDSIPIDGPGEVSQSFRGSEGEAPWEQEVSLEEAADVGAEAMSAPATSGSSEAPRDESLIHPSSQLYIRRFTPPAGVGRGHGRLDFQNQRDLDHVRGQNEFGPFLCADTWKTTKWLMRRGITSEARDEFFKLGTTMNTPDIPWTNEDAFMKDVDRLPRGATWSCQMIQIEGDNEEQGGRARIEEYELWSRDIVQCARELIGNPAFNNVMKFAPEKHFRDAGCTIPVYDEMWTGSWWWDTQTLLPVGVTIGALIIASDKTQLTKLSGDKEAWPVYLSLGNLPKAVRRQVSQHAMILVAYIPIAKLKCFQTKARRQKERWDFFHTCMKEVFRPLLELGNSTIPIVCCDNLVRDFSLVVAAYIADHPEQSLVCCTRENRCPQCLVSRHRRDALDETRKRDQRKSLAAIRAAIQGRTTRKIQTLGLRPTWPFWARLPRDLTNVHLWFWPDILHQLTKGMLEHLKDWVVAVVGVEEIDSRCETLTRYPGLKSFSKGLSEIKQWTGNEFKELLRIMIAVSVHALPDEALVAVRAYVDFQFLALLHRHTQWTVDVMHQKLELFHTHRDVFRTLGAVHTFNFPKSHSMNHFPAAISRIGALDGTNSEGPERLHIDMAKVAYHAVKKTDYIRFMTIWLDRQEALNRHEAYIDWVHNLDVSSLPTLPISDLSEGYQSDMNEAHLHAHAGSAEAPLSSAYVTGNSRQHIIAKRPSLKPKCRLHPSEMERLFGLFDFLTCANDFITKVRGRNFPTPSPVSEKHIFLCWSRFRIYHQTLYEFGTSDEHEQVRTLPAQSGQRARENKEAIFDTVLVYTSPGKRFPHCYQVAQVRAIFAFPKELEEVCGKHFALVELFTRFPKRPHHASGFYPVSRLVTRNTTPACKIVPISDIPYSCHLTPKLRRASEITWTSHQALNECKTFYLNTDASRRLWALSMGFMSVE